MDWATDSQRMADRWRGRGVVAVAAARLRPDGSRIFAGEDISVPLSRVTEALRRIKELGREFGVAVVNYGHIGDGNVHTAPVINLENSDEVKRGQTARRHPPLYRASWFNYRRAWGRRCKKPVCPG